MIPIIMISIFSEKILLVIKMDPNVAKYAKQYIIAYLPGCYLHCLNNA